MPAKVRSSSRPSAPIAARMLAAGVAASLALALGWAFLMLPHSAGLRGPVAANLAPVYTTGIGRRDDEFAVVRAGLNYKFGSY